MRIAERLLVCLAVCVALVSPAHAQSREEAVPLSDILKAARHSPDLLRQIDVELRRNDLKPGDVACVAAPLGGQFRMLSGGLGAPYQCQFGDRTLRIEADRIFFDIRGKRLGPPAEAGNEMLFEKAKSFRDTNLQWRWTPGYPR